MNLRRISGPNGRTNGGNLYPITQFPLIFERNPIIYFFKSTRIRVVHSHQLFPMNHSRTISSHRCWRGMTLIELTVVIAVLLLLVTLLFVGGRAWKRGADRSMCIMQIRQVQMAVRSYSNLKEHYPGANVAPANLQAELFGPDLFMEVAPICPAGGLYTFDGNTIPVVGALYMTCSFDVSDKHIPLDYADW